MAKVPFVVAAEDARDEGQSKRDTNGRDAWKRWFSGTTAVAAGVAAVAAGVAATGDQRAAPRSWREHRVCIMATA